MISSRFLISVFVVSSIASSVAHFKEEMTKEEYAYEEKKKTKLNSFVFDQKKNNLNEICKCYSFDFQDLTARFNAIQHVCRNDESLRSSH